MQRLRQSQPDTTALVRAVTLRWGLVALAAVGAGHPRAPLGTGRPVGLGGRDPPLAWAGDLGAAVLIGALAGLPSALRAASLSPAKALWIL